MKLTLTILAFIGITLSVFSQSEPPVRDLRHYDILESVSAERIEKDINKLVNFGTRHTMSDTVSKKQGIGAARRWIKSELDQISKDCNNCLEVYYQRTLVKGDPK
ncbi:MAG: peptidase M28, partial [Cyclobacteriaceae bacterium]|nr:peptidase M28 [Cyclobacteriaceae bacterium]